MGIHQTRRPRTSKEPNDQPPNGNGGWPDAPSYSLKEAANILRLALWRVRQEVKAGNLRRIRVVKTREHRISKAEIERYMKLMAEGKTHYSVEDAINDAVQDNMKILTASPEVAQAFRRARKARVLVQ